MKKIRYKEIFLNSSSSSLLCYLNNKIASFFVYLLQRSPLNPNIITCLSFLFFLLAILFLVLRMELIFLFWIFISYTFDNMDGIWARTFNQSSLLGAWLDSTLDRVKDIILFFSLFFMTEGYLQVLSIFSILFYSLFLVLLLHSSIYLKIKVFPKTDFRKKIVTYGPAEFYSIVSLIFLFSSSWGIYFSILLLFIMIFISIRELLLVLRYFRSND